MSAEELLARIEEIDSDIERLKREKFALLYQLNTVRDPVARLPLEISSKIFIQCLPPDPKPGADHIPMRLLLVCNSWHDIALSTPALWAKACITSPDSYLESGARGYARFLERWLERAGSHVLDITLVAPVDTDVLAVVGSRFGQLETLQTSDSHHDGYLLGLVPNSILQSILSYYLRYQLLEGTKTELLPSLKKLKIKTVSDVCDEILLRLIRCAPNIIELVLEITPNLGQEHANFVVVLPNLRELAFGYEEEARGSWSFGPGIFKTLRAPKLETLMILPSRSHDVTIDDLISFLQQSLPPLRKLILSSFEPFVSMYKCLALVPDLAYMKILQPHPEVIKYLLTILAESPPNRGVLQSLRNLDIQYAWSHRDDHEPWCIILQVLSAFRPEVSDISICINIRLIPHLDPWGILVDDSDPHDHILAALEESFQSTEGLDVHIIRDAAYCYRKVLQSV